MSLYNNILWTPAIDADIRDVYGNKERGGNKRIALKWNINKRAISERAAILHLPPLIASESRGSSSRWRPKELAILQKHSGEPTAQLRARLYAKGCPRSLTSIRAAVRRLRESGDAPDREAYFEDRNRLTVKMIQEGLGVSKWMLEEWIRKGWLKTQQGSPRSVHLVHYRDLRQFLIDHVSHWDHRKADRFFMVDVLTNTIAEGSSQR